MNNKPDEMTADKLASQVVAGIHEDLNGRRGYEERDAWEINFGSGSSEETQIDCGRCEEEYTVSREVSVSYSTRKMK